MSTLNTFPAVPTTDEYQAVRARLQDAHDALEYGEHGLDLDAATVRVRASLDRVRDESGAYRRQPPKSKASRRDVPLAADAVKALREHRLATGRPEDGSPVFSRPDGGQWTPIAPYRAFRRAAKAADIAAPLPNPHDARHAYATWLLGARVSVHAVAKLLGHRDATLVLKRYGHALPDEVQGAGDTLADWLEERKASQNRHAAATGGADTP